MREQIEILIYQYKKRNNLDVYTSLSTNQMHELLAEIFGYMRRIEFKTEVMDKNV